MSGMIDGHAQGRPEQAEERKRRQIDLAGLDAVESAQHLDLGGEDAVRVDDALGDAGAAAGEQDRGRLVGDASRPRDSIRGPPRQAANLVQRYDRPSRARVPTVTQVRTESPRPAEQHAGKVRLAECR